VAFSSPTPGEALLGTVLIVLEINTGTPTSIELSFSYRGDPRETWFLISEESSVDQQEISFAWDTTTISDGDYTIKVKAETEEEVHVYFLPDLRVRNYSPVETHTPIPTSTPVPRETAVMSVKATSTPTPLTPTATSMPPNPALITMNDIKASIIKGALVTFGLFVFLGIYQTLQARRRKKSGD
jgi:hypothetical protein